MNDDLNDPDPGGDISSTDSPRNSFRDLPSHPETDSINDDPHLRADADTNGDFAMVALVSVAAGDGNALAPVTAGDGNALAPVAAGDGNAPCCCWRW